MTTSASDNNNDKIPSPCVRNCCLNENDVCIGCNRSLSEILNWRELPVSEQKKIMERNQLNKKG